MRKDVGIRGRDDRQPDTMPILRGAAVAILDPRKLTHYCLDPESRLGQHKARVFAAAPGFDRSHAADLIPAIRRGILTHEARHVATTAYGEIWQVDVPVTEPGGSAIVRRGWIYEEAAMSRSSQPHSFVAEESHPRRYHDLDCVRLLCDLPGQGLRRGEIGTIDHVFVGADAYLVEFIDERDRNTRAEVELTPDRLEPA